MQSETGYFKRIAEHTFAPTAHAGGAWRDDELHLAPVAGLLVHELENWRLNNTDGTLQFARIAFEVLGQIMREPIDVEIAVLRPGRTIELVEITATIAGRVTLRGRAWLLQTPDTAEIAGNDFAAMPALAACTKESWLTQWPGGFIKTIQAYQSDDTRPGRAKAWVRSELPIVVRENSTPLAEFTKVFDTANGISVRANPQDWMYPNIDLTMHFFRQPAGGWVGFDTSVAFGANGIGLTSTVVHDEQGPVGTISQSLTLRDLRST